MAQRRIVLASLVLAALCGGAMFPACSPRSAEPGSRPLAVRGAPTIVPPPMGAERPVYLPGLHNVVTYHPGFICGGVPEGDKGMETLAAMGVTTIISVDGTEPDVASAKAHGMKYVHLPIGYNGFDEKREAELTRAVRDLSPEGPIYIHCHHGKHRSAGAAGTVAVCLGWMDNDEATRLMKVSGTAPSYTGLYKCTADARALTAAQIDVAPASFPEVSPPSGFVQGMVDVDEASDHLRAIERAEWKVPADHPDLVPTAEAGRLADLFRKAGTGAYVNMKPAEFGTLLRQANERAQMLEELLAGGEADTKKLSAQLGLVAASCQDCHAKYRD